jgi:hydrogenase/urease accessory protein HupE
MNANSRRFHGPLIAGIIFALAPLASAHPGHGRFDGSESATSQFLHPFVTADHLVPAVAAGIVVLAVAKLVLSRRRS